MPTSTIQPAFVASPFDTSHVARGEDGLMHYTHLPRSCVDLLRRHALERPDRTAVVELDGGSLTYGELWEAACRVAGGLKAAGISPGDRTAILCPAGLDWVLALIGSMCAGAIPIPVNTRFAPPEVEYVLADSGAAYTFSPGQPLPDGEPFTTDPSPQDIAAIFYTSGTTGHPKGALTTHEAFLTCAENMSRSAPEPLTENDSTLISVPLFHVTGCNAQLVTMFLVGGCAVIMPTLDVGRLVREITDSRITLMVTVPAIYAMVLAHADFDSEKVGHVTRVGYGGAPIAPALVHRIKAAFPNARVNNGFGLTETAALLTSLPHEDAADYADSVGFPFPVSDVALYLKDEETGVGELLTRGPNITPGYWNKPEQSAIAFEDGWFHTGDLARIDDVGRVFIVDRAKDMINRGGENVYSVEVENALTAVPGVFECAVVGVPNDKMGEAVGAVIVPIPGMTVTPDGVVEALRGKIADFKIPQYIDVRESPLPRNPGGKILKSPLRRDTMWRERLH